jgi:hypothetical protein
MDLASLTSCRELTMEHADEAARSLEKLRALLVRITEIAEPEDGAPKVLMIFARLARGDIAWLEGDLTVEITGNEERTLIDVYRDEGWGIRERLATQARFKVPFDEFEGSVEISAKRFEPLKVNATGNKITLTTAAAAPKARAVPPVELGENSLGTAPPPSLGVPQEPEPFELPPASEPEPFEPSSPTPAVAVDVEPGFGVFLDEPGLDPGLAGAIVSPRKKADPVPFPDPLPAAADSPPPAKPPDPVHNRPTVRRMVAITAEALRTGRKDPRREEDD